MASEQERAELDRRAREGETVVPGGTGGKSLEAQERLAEGRRKGGHRGRQSRKEGNEDSKLGGGGTRNRSGEADPDEGIDKNETK